MSIFVETLGCKVNLYESEQIAYRLESASTDESQNVCVINTCTVTQEADGSLARPFDVQFATILGH